MEITVIIPVYNRAELVKGAVCSVLEQTAATEEIIIIDDGSADNPHLEFSTIKDSRLKVIRQKNKGVSAARNKGIKESQAEWLAFLDSDDRWLPQKLEKQVAFHRKNPECLISQTDEIWIRNGKRVNPKNYHLKPEGNIFELSLSRCLISPSAVLIHRKLFGKIGLFDEDLPACEDYDMWLRISSKYPVGLIKEKLVVKTGGRSDQLSQKFWGMDIFRIKALEKLLNSNSLTPDQQKAVIKKLTEKLKIVVNGAKKHSNTELAQEFESILSKYGLVNSR